MAHTTHRYRRRTRPGFTLIEILVVLAIMGLLFTLSGAAYQRFRVAGQVKATEDLVAKLQGGVDDQLKVIADNARREQLQGSPDYTGIMNYCGGDADRALALLGYLRVRQNFPQTTAELQQKMANGQFGFTVGGVNFPQPPVFNKLAALTGTPEQIAAACLYTALTERTLAGKVFDSDAGTSGRHLDITLASGTARVYRDTWNQPVLLKRFYTDAFLDAPPYTKANSAYRDPFDPLGKLATWNPNPVTFRTAVEASPYAGTTFSAANKAVLVYSVGKNGATTMPVSPDADDIVGYKLRSLGARGAQQP